jgi:glutamine cyclotransferase
MGSSSRKDGSSSRGSTPPGSGSTSPTSASVAAEQAKRARANSIGASITQGQLRRRKRDMPHELWRRLIRLKDANGRVKLGLFLGLAAALWLLLIFTAPDQPSSNSNSNAKPAIGPAITSFDTAAAGSFDGASLASIPPQAVAAASSATASAPTATTAIDYSKQTPPTVAAQVLRRYPHDSRAFTQGLLFDSQGQLWESTGMYGESEVRRVDLDTGVVVERWSLPDNRFGEGMAMMSSGEQEQLVQLTWREHDVFVYDAHNLTLGPLKRHRLATEGWGITTMPVPLTAAPAAGGNVADVMTAAAAAAGQQQTQQQQSEQLIVSDGSSTLQFIDPDTFEVRRKLQVRAFKKSVSAQKDCVPLHAVCGKRCALCSHR